MQEGVRTSGRDLISRLAARGLLTLKRSLIFNTIEGFHVEQSTTAWTFTNLSEDVVTLFEGAFRLDVTRITCNEPTYLRSLDTGNASIASP
jgi:hypothetical protein